MSDVLVRQHAPTDNTRRLVAAYEAVGDYQARYGSPELLLRATLVTLADQDPSRARALVDALSAELLA